MPSAHNQTIENLKVKLENDLNFIKGFTVPPGGSSITGKYTILHNIQKNMGVSFLFFQKASKKLPHAFELDILVYSQITVHWASKVLIFPEVCIEYTAQRTWVKAKFYYETYRAHLFTTASDAFAETLQWIEAEKVKIHARLQERDNLDLIPELEHQLGDLNHLETYCATHEPKIIEVQGGKHTTWIKGYGAILSGSTPSEYTYIFTQAEFEAILGILATKSIPYEELHLILNKIVEQVYRTNPAYAKTKGTKKIATMSENDWDIASTDVHDKVIRSF